MTRLFLNGKNGSIIGNYAIVDDEDFELINKTMFKWYLKIQENSDTLNYAITDTRYINRNNPIKTMPSLLKLHRFILNITDSKIKIDHINGDGLDCRKINLRIATHTGNGANRKVTKGSSSKYLGVTFDGKNLYKACITKNGKCHYLGVYRNENQAALVYNNAAKILHGEFARLNIIE